MHAMQALSQLSYSPTNVVQVLNSKYLVFHYEKG
ncbi:hypothetical protein XBKQ1_1410004 [Xenorhabdus bovienii str. kraussei Quebec]|uniref:Uncharacterized protein n=1 Tax=Xenorhabdus bovienii str. kraussei Quebec TaxID=1398203 RepID=A0A077PDB4_XENBV|nr:hypothetical protein XBKQ1_1410004 [Xenorhabdus bovienii str. kraussei Quebec]